MKNRSAAEAGPHKRSQEERERKCWLRQLFVERAAHYIGTPYSKRTIHHPKAKPEHVNAKFFLDCCALVKRVVRDLSPHFGFQLYWWNQGYQFDTLPIVSNAMRLHQVTSPHAETDRRYHGGGGSRVLQACCFACRIHCCSLPYSASPSHCCHFLLPFFLPMPM